MASGWLHLDNNNLTPLFLLPSSFWSFSIYIYGICPFHSRALLLQPLYWSSKKRFFSWTCRELLVFFFLFLLFFLFSLFFLFWYFSPSFYLLFLFLFLLFCRFHFWIREFESLVLMGRNGKGIRVLGFVLFFLPELA